MICEPKWFAWVVQRDDSHRHLRTDTDLIFLNYATQGMGVYISQYKSGKEFQFWRRQLNDITSIDSLGYDKFFEEF